MRPTSLFMLNTITIRIIIVQILESIVSSFFRIGFIDVEKNRTKNITMPVHEKKINEFLVVSFTLVIARQIGLSIKMNNP